MFEAASRSSDSSVSITPGTFSGAIMGPLQFAQKYGAVLEIGVFRGFEL